MIHDVQLQLNVRNVMVKVNVGFGSDYMLIDYVCDDCAHSEMHFGVVPNLKCPKCGLLLTAEEEFGDDKQ